MNRSQLSHLLRAASALTDERDILVFGSQAILGSYDEDNLPEEAVFSVEADLTFFSDPEDLKINTIDTVLGSPTHFSELYGYYAEGFHRQDAILPENWEFRLVLWESSSMHPARALCLDPHDMAISKLIAGRDKDYPFVSALLKANLLSYDILLERANATSLQSGRLLRILSWIETHRARYGSSKP